jgi:L-asparaginase / beta-aspartyl-peptidase
MKKIAIVLHGGADRATPFLKRNIIGSEKGLKEALLKGYTILKKGGTALSAVEEVVILLEDNPLFNAGRGSALNNRGEVEMDASIMDGKTLKAGAVSIVRTVKNPVALARTVMTATKHVFLSGYGALELANATSAVIEPDSYFITQHKYDDFLKFQKKNKHTKNTLGGTVGAVALDVKGNLAAATSTGGTSNCLPGRVGDTCIIGAGCYANNRTCAVSGTGDGEFLITNVVAHSISMLIELKNMSLQKACDFVIHKRKYNQGQMGVIAVDPKGNIGISFNTEVMRRAWMSEKGEPMVKFFK